MFELNEFNFSGSKTVEIIFLIKVDKEVAGMATVALPFGDRVLNQSILSNIQHNSTFNEGNGSEEGKLIDLCLL